MQPYRKGLISVDDHIIEPPNLFTHFCSDKFRDRAPQYGHREGFIGWSYEDRFYGISKAATAAGQPWGKAGIFVPSETVPLGLDDVTARLEAMDQDGIAMSLCFPSMMGLGGETMAKHADKEVGLACIEAYNRFLHQHWLYLGKKRFIGAMAVPLWDPAQAARMVRVGAIEGFKAVLFPQAPHQIGYPPVWSDYWKPLFDACETNCMVLVQHIFSDDTEQYTASGLPPYLPLTLGRTSAIETIGSWILTPALDAHPRLKIMVAESGVGWIPWFLAVANESARLHRFEFGSLKVMPAQRFENHFGLSLLGTEIVPDGIFDALPGGVPIMFESDYPHLDGSYPLSVAAFASFGLPNEDAVARDNAVAFFGLTNPFQFRQEAA